MSNTNDINFKGTEGDAEGHVGRFKGLDDGSGTDTEGHLAKVKLDDGSGTDAEGRSARRGGFDDGSDTDAEGHARRGPEPTADDAEGHAAKPGRAATTGTGSGKPRVRW